MSEMIGLPRRPKRSGHCYELALHHILGMQEGTLIHGEVYSYLLGRVIDHAWVETETGFIYEPESCRYFRKDQLYKEFKMKELQRYSVREAANMALGTETYGPWTEEQRKQFIRR